MRKTGLGTARMVFGALAATVALVLFVCSVFVAPRFDFGMALLALLCLCGGALLLAPLFAQ